MKTIKILLVLIAFTGVTYWGIEPLAHSVFHPHVAPADFTFADIYENPQPANVKARRDEVGKLIALGSIDRGKELFNNMGCAGCHSIKEDNYELDPSAQVAQNHVVPPDLSYATLIFDEAFLMEYLKDPNHAAYKTTYALHKKAEAAKEAKGENAAKKKSIEENAAKAIVDFDAKIDSQMITMAGFLTDDQQTSDMLAYLRSVANKPGVSQKMDDRNVTIEACGRCHTVNYDKQFNTTLIDDAKLTTYLGSLPPDLSMMIKSKGAEYLQTFINDPQKHLIGTTMPRVGLNAKAQNQVVSYIESVGDPKKGERESMGMYFVGYFLLLAVLAFMWKHNEFAELKDRDED